MAAGEGSNPGAGSYQYRRILSRCESNQGIIEINGVYTDEITVLGVIILKNNVNQGQYDFLLNSRDGSFTFRDLAEDGEYEVRLIPYYGGAMGDWETHYRTISCGPATPENTGYKGWQTLEEYYTDTNEATGQTKPNVPTQSDYVPPELNTTFCPVPTP